MLGLHKAFCVLLLCLPLVTCARWDWSESVFHLGNWWRKHFDTDYWCLVDGDGELMHDEDVDWYVSHGYDLPWPEQGCRRYRGRKAPRTCHDGDGNTPGASSSTTPWCGASSASGPPGGLPAQGSGDSLIDALQHLQELLVVKNRWDTHSFRSQLRRTIRRLCIRENITCPDWYEGTGLSTHQYKMKAHQFTTEILNRKLGKLNTGPVTGLPAQGSGVTPGTTPAATPPGTPRGADPDAPSGSGLAGGGPSAAQMVVYMMENMLDDLDVMHPGVRDEVRQRFGSPRFPGTIEVPGHAGDAAAETPGPEGLPAQGSTANNQTMPDAESTSSSETESLQADPRRTKSEPPRSPPRNVSMEAVDFQGETLPPAEETATPAAEGSAPAAEETAAPAVILTPGPGGLPEQGSMAMANSTHSWAEVSEVPTEESFTVVADPEEIDKADL